ncbi:MAG: D-alanine--D-alanine ligase, partial [Armatimonadetes bacterium]|nr:D-alanine--D-alanine ligase [Armatimonadota bacterium]NIM24709.1 D-alanine--D-alanine ligase [Armatimonadota bacterium]NIM68589.1 D-alanine--D-alanine ligase [Armatimonadota bacterium]NIM77106.1 D-alanine--D-alanine ligase [Armatimonadota bacterium]NIN06783.1 D-alanine--D-alanine ligase [Armatimonadota bacterium]
MVKLRIAVLMGGDSAEREVSLLSGKAVLEGLDRDKYTAIPVVLESVPRDPDELPSLLRDGEVDLAFLALHGGAGEDG